jgi:hypothetical protein
MSRYRVYFRWSYSYFHPMTPFHESGGMGEDMIDVEAPDAESAVDLASEEEKRSLEAEVMALQEDPSYSFSVVKVELL